MNPRAFPDGGPGEPRRGGPPDGRVPPTMPGLGEAAPGPSLFGPPEAPRDRGMRAFSDAWERNIGPLDKTPAVKRAIFEFGDGPDPFTDATGKSLWDSQGSNPGNGGPFGDLFNGLSFDGLKMSSSDLPFMNWSMPNWGGGGSSPSTPSGKSWFSGSGGPSSSSSDWGGPRGGFDIGFGSVSASAVSALLLLLLAIVVGFVVWRLWPLRVARPGDLSESERLSRWPFDPRRLNTREHVVIAFEYLSVQICGPAAKTWTHTTIAQAIADLATTDSRTARMLARLYELARYTPVDEPLTLAEIGEARRLVCHLAGLGDE